MRVSREDYQATALRQIGELAKDNGKEFALTSDQWHKTAAFILLMRAGVVVCVPSFYRQKLYSAQTRAEARLVALRAKMTLRSAAELCMVEGETLQTWDKLSRFSLGATAKEIFETEPQKLWRATNENQPA